MTSPIVAKPPKPAKPVAGPTFVSVRADMAKRATDLVAAQNAKAKPGVNWSWAWGSRGIQVTVRVRPAPTAAPK